MEEKNRDEEFPSVNEQGKNFAKFTFEVVKNVIDLSPSNETKLLLSKENRRKEWIYVRSVIIIV